MEKKEVKKIYTDSLSKNVMDQDLINYVIDKEIYDKDLYSAIDGVEYNNVMGNFGKLCHYDPLTKTLNIDSNILSMHDYQSETDMAQSYSLVFSGIYRELTHAKHELLVQKWENYYSKLGGKYSASPSEIREIILIDLFKLTYQASRKKYNKYKTILPSEHEANFYSQYKTMELERELDLHNKKTEEYRVLTLTRLLLEGYKYGMFNRVISPVERLRSNSEDIRDMMSNFFNSYERLVYGMPVSDRTINSIATIYKNGNILPKCSTFENVEDKLLKRNKII